MLKMPAVTSSEILATGQYLSFERLRYQDRHGDRRAWETVRRCGDLAAVMAIPVIRATGEYVIIRQFRPPVGRYVLEFPAGLVDPGETPGEAALRELREETGYHGQVVWETEPACSSPGITGELVALAGIDIDLQDTRNAQPVPQCDDGEQIDVYTASGDELGCLLKEAQAQAWVIDSRMAAYFLGQGIHW